MGSYTVKAGDTLSTIANKILGDAGKWRLLMELNRLPNPNRLRAGQILYIPEPAREVSQILNTVSGSKAGGTEQVRIVEQGKVVFVIAENDQWFKVGTRHRAGLYRVGRYSPEAFIQQSAALLRDLTLSPSEIRVIASIAKNEGNLDAVNTWDNQFLSFGMFQWTLGSADKPGELASLLARINRTYPTDFQHYFGRFGIGVDDTTESTGWLRLEGHLIRSKADKERLRSDLWAYRFATAGADIQVQAAQVAQAVDRIRQFYPTPSKVLGGYSLSQLITSEYGVALLLDNHVNRPGYLYGCIAQSIIDCGLTPQQLAQGNDADEQAVVDAYLKIRPHYGRNPMTNAIQRGYITANYLSSGELSQKRKSFT